MINIRTGMRWIKPPRLVFLAAGLFFFACAKSQNAHTIGKEEMVKAVALKALPNVSPRFRKWQADKTPYTVRPGQALSAQDIQERLRSLKSPEYAKNQDVARRIKVYNAAGPGELWPVSLWPNSQTDQDINCLVDMKTEVLVEFHEHRE